MTSALTDHGSTRAWRRIRRAYERHLAEAGQVQCWRCGNPIRPGDRWHLGHRTDRALGGTDHPDNLGYECDRCSTEAGGQLGGRRAAANRRELERLAAIGRDHDHDHDRRDAPAGSLAPTPADTPAPVSASLPPHRQGSVEVGPDADDPVWDRCGWLDSLRVVPGEATWPRLMTGPHPAAVGSYGAELIVQAEQRSGRVLRWWQQLAVTRMLEHDADGALVWLVVLLSTARQVGKSILLGESSMWRIHQAERFGEEQLVMHTGKDLAVCREVQRWARSWAMARRDDGYRVRNVNGQDEVAAPDGSRWMVRSQDAVYGYPVTLPLVDEAWKVDASVVDEGLEPTMSERVQPQLLIASTAHRRATSLFVGRRRAALAQLTAPDDVLLLEWSARPDAELTDRAGWRQASPHWSPRREKLLASKVNRALAGERDPDDPDEPDPVESFRAQYLNVWPAARSVARHPRDEVLVDADEWADAAAVWDVPGVVVVALEDWKGAGAAGAVAGRSVDGRVCVSGRLFGSRRDALSWAGGWLDGGAGDPRDAGSRLLVGASWAKATDLDGVEVTAMGQAETRSALPALREAFELGGVCHDGSVELTEQVEQVLVVPGVSGLAISPRSPRSDLLRCAAWAVFEVGRQVPAAPIPFIV